MKTLPRRAILRGAAGVGLSLPWLEIMQPTRRAHAAAAPTDTLRRLVVWWTPNGIIPNAWRCQGQGASFELSRILKPLERHKSDLVVIEGLSITGGGYGHWQSTPHLLTGTKHGKGSGGIAETAAHATMDHEMAKEYGRQTKLGTLQVGVGVGPDIDGHADATISYTAPNRPVYMQDDPYQLAGILFSATTNPIDVKRLQVETGSVLDACKANLLLLESRLGQEDRERLDAYATSVRAIEQDIAKLTGAAPNACPSPLDMAMRPKPLSYEQQQSAAPDIGKLQMKIIETALACDLSRIITFMWARCAGSERSHDWLGAGGNWHELSHAAAEGNGTATEKMIKINVWYNELLATFIDALKARKEGDRSVFDSTVVLVANEFGFNHYHDETPFLLVGSCNGFFKTGQILRFPAKQRGHNGILVALWQALGFDRDQWGDPAQPAGVLPGLKA